MKMNKFYFGKDNEGDVKAFEPASIVVEGKSGSGKSTFVNQMLLNMITLDSGVSEVHYFTRYSDFVLKGKQEGVVQSYIFDTNSPYASYVTLRLLLNKVSQLITRKHVEKSSDMVIVCLDEINFISNLTNEDREWVLDCITNLMVRGKKAGVFFVLVGQSVCNRIKRYAEYSIRCVYSPDTRKGHVVVNSRSSTDEVIQVTYYNQRAIRKVNKGFRKSTRGVKCECVIKQVEHVAPTFDEVIQHVTCSGTCCDEVRLISEETSSECQSELRRIMSDTLGLRRVSDGNK